MSEHFGGQAPAEPPCRVSDESERRKGIQIGWSLDNVHLVWLILRSGVPGEEVAQI